MAARMPMITPAPVSDRIRRYACRIVFTRPVRFRFLHGGSLTGAVRRALNRHELPDGLVLFAGESGRVEYAPGDEYRFGLTAVDGPADLRERLLRGLDLLGASPVDPGRAPPTFGGNFRCIDVEQLRVADVAGHPAVRRKADALTLRFLSPLRMARPQGLDRPREKYLNESCFPPAHFLDKLAARAERLFGNAPPRGDMSGLRADAELLWLDMPVSGSRRLERGRPKGYTMGGVVGTVSLSGLEPEHLELLALGELIQAGEKTHYGFGRFVIQEDLNPGDDPFGPATTLRDRLTDEGLLAASLRHVVEHSVAAGVDHVHPAELDPGSSLPVAAISRDLQTGTYTPADLRGFLIPKKPGGYRPLAVPTVRDRCVQRAAMELLSPAVETLLENCSYGYRKGLSRQHAARAIQRAWDEGYRHVLDADIESFFDSVTWPRMLAKFRALFPFSGIDELIAAWLDRPVVYEGRRILREQGLPQGSPISPLLANLFLDEFDEELLGKGFRLVRYADDFVVLCRSLEEAEGAREHARAALSELGLELNDEKTRVTGFEQGFTYLGYLFCRSLVLEQLEDPAGKASVQIPARSWLAGVKPERSRRLEPVKKDAPEAGGIRIVPLAEASSPPGADSRSLYVTGFDTAVRLQNERLVIDDPDGHHEEVPLRTLSHVVSLGRVDMTLPALLALARAEVPVYFCSRTGEVDVTVGEPAPDLKLWMHQQQARDDDRRVLEFARTIIAAKLHNQATLAVRFRLQGGREAAAAIRSLERTCAVAEDADVLRGLEGRAAALFFGALKGSLDGAWGFQVRNRRPPADPVNAMLSFGYTLLHHHAATALRTHGLHPRLGIFHGEHGAHHALASDLQEEFHHLVDAQVVAMIRRREAKPRDFHASADGHFPCLMAPPLFRKFIHALDKRLATEFTPPDGGEKVTYRRFLDRQAMTLASWIRGDRNASYEALRIHA